MDIIKLFEIKELSQEFMHPPQIDRRGDDSVLLFDYETDTGEYEWTGVTFKNTINNKHTKDNEISEYMVKAYNSVVEVKNSAWINKIAFANKNSNLNAMYKHFLVYFDGYGAYEFISTDAIKGISE